MMSFKSSPLIQQSQRARRGSKRESQRPSKQIDFKIANPFRHQQQQNFLPHALREQVQQMQFVSTKSITNINFEQPIQSQRRSSNFAKHLNMMQNAARKQNQKFQGLVHKKQKRVQIQSEMMQEQSPINLSELDNLSIEMENCLNEIDYRDLDNQQFGIFDQQYGNNEVVFYSQQQIQPEINNDFSCYFNT